MSSNNQEQDMASMLAPSKEVCECKENEVCHLCPDSKRRKIIHRIDGTDPNRYVAAPPAHAKGRLTRRERLHQERQVRGHFETRMGRRMSNSEWEDMKQLIAARTKKQMEGADGR